jgi:hypothetical protein
MPAVMPGIHPDNFASPRRHPERNEAQSQNRVAALRMTITA